MTDERPFDPEEKRTDPPSEGVRIIGAEEAAEALERGDVAQRRGEDEPRYGDRPTPPAADGPRPVLRFPLGSSSDPRDIERPAVVSPNEPISEQVELPHWTEPPTGQVPQILSELAGEEGDDLDDWTSFATSTPRWRDDAASFDDQEGFEDMQAWASSEDEEPLGALDDSERPTHDDYFTFADLDDTGTTSRSVFAEDVHDDDGFGPDWADEPEPGHAAAPLPRRTTRTRREPMARPGRTARPSGGDRDMGVAVAVGLGLFALALFLFKLGPRRR